MFTVLSTKVGTIPLWVMSLVLCMCLGGPLVAEINSPPGYLACNDNVNVSVDDACQANITIQLILEGEESYPGFDPSSYTVTVEGFPTGPSVIVDGLGTYAVTITEIDDDGNYVNSCWGNILVEDKLPPIIGDDPSTPDDPLDPTDDEVACPCPVGNTSPDCVIGTCLDYDAFLAGDILMPMPHVYDGCTATPLVSFADVVTPGGDCSPTLVRRTYVFSDDSGNKVTSCINEYRVMPVNVLTDVVAPVPNIYLECGAGTTAQDIYAHYYAELLATYLAAATTPAQEAQAIPDAEAAALLYAYPTINGYPLPNASTQCNIATVSSDLDVYPCSEECANMKKVIREWNIYNWCDNTSLVVSQIIVTQDDEGPEVTANDLTVSVDPWGCFGIFDIPDPEHIYDDCSDKTSYSVSGPAGVTIQYDPDRGYYVTDAPKGDHVFYYDAVDCCGNLTSEPFNVYIVDNTPPVAIAKQDIVISLTTNNNGSGIAKIFTFNIDNGSYDGCSPVHLEIRREKDYCGILDNLTYNDDGHTNDKNSDQDEGAFVKFCCEDFAGAGVDEDGDGISDYALIKVWLRVWDDGDMDGVYGSSGDNYNETWAYVRLEDKLTPTIQCPPNVTIGCEEDYLNLDLTGSATAIASCEPLMVEYEDVNKVINGCGAGFIKRKWSVVGHAAIFCVQTITIQGSEPGDIIVDFPDDATVTCSDIIGNDKPTWVAGPCDEMAWSLEVDTFYIQSDACFKVLKSWTVINWCTYDPDADDDDQVGIWTDTQIIKVLDDIKPVFESCDDVMFEVNDDADSDNDGVICENNVVMLTNVAYDEGVCSSNDLSWIVQIDLDGNWTIDHEFSSSLPTNSPYYIAPTESGDEVKITLPESIAGSMTNHRVVWRVTDGCGNYTACTNYFMVVDKTPPTPYCQNISTAFMQNGMVAIWACDFDLGSYDNCTDYDNLRFTFSDTHPDLDPDYIKSLKCSSYIFDCDDLPSGPNAGSPIPVEMYVWDEKDNYSYCTVYLTILDNNNSCDTSDPDGAARMIAGNIVTPEGEDVMDVQVNLMSTLPQFPVSDMTDNDGHYAFSNVLSNNSYVLEGEKNDDYKNGVSTVDIILIQRHLLNIAPFTSPYSIIAADANSDEKVSAGDMVDIRKLILGANTEFPNSDSWVFIDQGQVLNVPNPWPLDRILDIQNLQSDMMTQDFIGVKVGDVNSSVTLNNATDDSEFRSAQNLILNFDNADVVAGEQFSVELSTTVEDLFGLQMTIGHTGLNLVEITSDIYNVNDDNFVAYESGLTSLSLNSTNAISLEKEVLFTLTFEAETSMTLADVLTVDYDVINSEAYTGSDLAISDVVLQSSENGFALLQNRPNPFSQSTDVSFVLPESGSATLTVFDITGKVSHTTTRNYEAGLNSETISRDMLSGSGVWFYRLDSGDFSDTKKLTLVD